MTCCGERDRENGCTAIGTLDRLAIESRSKPKAELTRFTREVQRELGGSSRSPGHGGLIYRQGKKQNAPDEKPKKKEKSKKSDESTGTVSTREKGQVTGLEGRSTRSDANVGECWTGEIIEWRMSGSC